jgi:REP element-mobilizing transposase RayT
LLRGINQQRVFEEDIDYERLLLALEKAIEAENSSLLAYCLMDNHIHLLIEEGNEELGQTIKRLGVRYAMWFNMKYQRVGQLFQNRFPSEAIETDAYFVTVVRYIYENPLKAGLCKRAEDYLWSSRRLVGSKDGIVDEKRLRELCDLDALCVDTTPLKSADVLDLPEAKRHYKRDEEAFERLCELSKVSSASAFQAVEKLTQEAAILRLLEEGFGLRQTARVSGLSKGLVESWRRRAQKGKQ